MTELGAAGLTWIFTACIDCYQLIRRGAAQDRDSKILETRFNNQELRLTTWGRACGLLGPDVYNERLDEPVVRARIIESLKGVQGLFEDKRQLKKLYGLRQPNPIRVTGLLSVSGRNAIATGDSPTDSVEARPPKEPFFLSKKQQGSLSRFRNDAHWVISDRVKFSELVQHLKNFNDDLEAMTRSFNGIYDRQRQMVRMEMEQVVEVETLEEIALASQGDADVISDMISLRLESIGAGSDVLTETGANTADSSKSAVTPTATEDALEEEHMLQSGPILTKMPLRTIYKCAIVGDHEAGKLRLIASLLNNGSLPFYIPTAIYDRVVELRVDDFEVNLTLWDTTRMEEYDLLRPLTYTDAHVVLVCFRANDPTAATKESILQNWMPEVAHFCPGAPVILVGLNNPQDSVDESEATGPKKAAKAAGRGSTSHTQHGHLQRQQEDGEEDVFDPVSIQRDMGARKYFYCDPETGFGVSQLFDYAAREAVLFGDRPRGFRRRVKGFMGSG